ncbi:MAG TPA: SIS domain-containing protein [Thermoplasmata archaeon]|nr:SIS domain-containing protein [Thermoplasmata archaeon]
MQREPRRTMDVVFPGPEDPSPPYGRTAHPYFLHEMICSQPAAIHATVREAARTAEGIPPPPAGRPLLFVGMGTSFHAALASARAAGSAGLDGWCPRAIDSFDLFLEPELIRKAGGAIVFSSSGETALTLEAQRALGLAGVPQVLISGTKSSRSADLADHLLLTQAAVERAWVHTVSYTTAIAAALTLIRQWSDDPAFDLPELEPTLKEVVARESEWKGLAEQLRDRGKVLVLGSGAAQATAREAALKLREGAHRFVAATGVEEFLHGVLPSVDASTAVLAVTTSPIDRQRASTALAAATQAGAKVALLRRGPASGAGFEYSLPAIATAVTPLTDIVPFQFLTYWLAVGEGRNPDVMGYDDPRIFAARRMYGI